MPVSEVTHNATACIPQQSRVRVTLLIKLPKLSLTEVTFRIKDHMKPVQIWNSDSVPPRVGNASGAVDVQVTLARCS